MPTTCRTKAVKTLLLSGVSLVAGLVAAQLAIGLLLLQPSSAPVEDTVVPQPLERVTVPAFRIEADTADQLQRALWARERFALAGLELPSIEIRFHADETGCAGHQGLTTTVNDGEQIDICRTNNYVILHELAHAWEAHALDDDTRASFLALRGLTAWNDATLDWHERGTEHSANILAWGLTESSIPPIGIHPNDPGSLRRAFDLLIGTTSVEAPASDPPTTTLNNPPGP